jgi:hypothetical protein
MLRSVQDEAADKLDELVTLLEVGNELQKVVQLAAPTIQQTNRQDMGSL